MGSHAALVAKLVSAKEGSRELDGEIAKLFGWKPQGKGFRHWIAPKDCPWPKSMAGVPFYTTSLDAAVDLVPEGWSSGRISWPGRDSGYLKANARADLLHDSSSGGGPRETGFAATPALALVIAILKAVEAKDG